MTEREVFMLKCLVEYVEQISGNDNVYAHKNQVCVPLGECRDWLLDEQAKRSVYNVLAAFDTFRDHSINVLDENDMNGLETVEDILRGAGSNLIRKKSGDR